jgi:hypothetical protein
VCPKVKLAEETKGEGKKGKKEFIANNNEIYYICVGTRHNKTC